MQEMREYPNFVPRAEVKTLYFRILHFPQCICVTSSCLAPSAHIFPLSPVCNSGSLLYM